MSNKKRISNKRKRIDEKAYSKRLKLACQLMIEIQRNATNSLRGLALLVSSYSIGGLIPNSLGREKMADSHGDEIIIPKFEVRRHPYHLDSHKLIQ
ncbi:hypothetical protein EG359_17415 [Chryseobacterium joostei]|uniref:Uncharacterized protein n=1 Tax=Chryseobacterium joostei TaxID=112234 RepID=A0A1N7IBC0_9FLAO|nr:hypothetical protein [Chryseobacterium joostei]AZB01283.1 hypothetical protein EG359_17415 [Chryseobacterium joostei]SIS34282.1 hypothetical protein SAMN05421768_103683 [Chryseobacterium joostei]